MFDTIIVGGGSAGSVLANRLSAKSANQVLLLEAGQDTPHGKVPPEVLDSYPGTAYFDPRFHWTELKVRTEVVSHNNPQDNPPPLRKYEQARILGGGSSINGQLANRGAPADFEEWVVRGARGWGWADVLPFYKKIERDMDFEGPLHGREGRIPVRRIFPEQWTGHAKAAAEAFKAAGFAYLPDQNGEWRDGYYPIAISNAYERRVSAAIGYLDPTTRQRPNLTISTDLDECVTGADVIMTLRLQKERQESGLLPSLREYSRFFGITAERVQLAAPHCLVMHPGPMNEGVEIMPDVAVSAQSVIEAQVTNGVAVRMALLYRLANE